MRIIAVKTLREFWESHPDAEQPLRAWYATASRARWKRPSDVKVDYRNASFVGNNRVVFNIKGNAYRLLLAMRYDKGIGFVRFIGAHGLRPYQRRDHLGHGTMDIKPIKSETDYKKALRAIEELWEAKPHTLESDRLELLSILVEAFEREHHSIPPPDPIAAIEHRMESRGLTRKDLEPFIGSRARVSEVMGRRRPLTLSMIRHLAVELGIPADVLIQPYCTIDQRAA